MLVSAIPRRHVGRQARRLHTMPALLQKKDLNRHSRMVTQAKDQGASQAMLFATEGVRDLPDLSKAQVGVATMWYEGNPCNAHLLALGQRITKSLRNSDLLGYQFGTPCVSDGISNGTFGMSYSLQSRDLIADSVETVAGGHWLDGMVTVPGCDKNMPGVLMGLARLNRPGLMVYGGTIRPGSCEGQPQLDIVSAFQSYGRYLNEGETPQAEKFRQDTVRNACPGPGACGGMYTANTIASATEAMGMSLPGSSSFPAESNEKLQECDSIGSVMTNLLEKNIKPRDIMTRKALENAMVITMVLGGSTNLVLHLMAIAHSAGVEISIDDFQTVSDRTPYLADLRPSGKYVMEDLSKIGGVPAVLKYLAEKKMINTDILTVTGKSLEENLHNARSLPSGQEIIRPIENPIKDTGHIRILKGSLAPQGSVAKITGKEGLWFKGKAKCFETEDDLVRAIENKDIKKGEKTVIILRYFGPKGGPGMPEMLKPTSLVMGAGLGDDVACVTDGRFSGGSHGFVIGHVCDEAAEGGNIALVHDGDLITIDAEANTLNLDVSEEELARRRTKWTIRPPPVQSGTLWKYAKLVSNASKGAVTDSYP